MPAPMSASPAKLPWKEISRLGCEAGFYQAVMSAEQNAYDTIYVEKAAAPADHDRIALGALEERLTSEESTEGERAFFATLGVRW